MAPGTMALPSEVLQNVFLHLTFADQSALCSSALVSRSWYSNSISLLYSSPIIDGKNYDLFVRAICPSVNPHIRNNGLAEMVKTLDMSRLVHNGSKSLTARLLGRVKENLEAFVAPQASFAVNCLAALSKCNHLRRLDLSFVSESIAMSDLLRSVSFLSNLEVLHLPRSSTQDPGKYILKYDWPAKLREFHISGGLHDETTVYFSTLPPKVSHLSIGNCPHISMLSVGPLLQTKGPQLQYLEILAPISRLQLGQKPLNNIMDLVPNLRHLKISVDFIDTNFFLNATSEHPSLTRIDLHCFDTDDTSNINASNMYSFLELCPFSKVRVLGIHQKLGWASQDAVDVVDLDELLKAMAREDEPGAEIPEDDAGVVIFGKSGPNHPLHRL